MIEYQFDHDQRLLMMRISGVLQIRQLLEFQASLAADPQHDSSYVGIVDLLGVTDNELKSSDVHALAANRVQEPLHQRPKRTALIASRDDIFGLGRMFQMLADVDSETRVVRSLEEALKWLDLAPEDVQFLTDGARHEKDRGAE